MPLKILILEDNKGRQATMRDSLQDRLLQEAGWTTYRVTPHGDLEWVSSQWRRTLRWAVLTATAKPAPRSTATFPSGSLEQQP